MYIVKRIQRRLRAVPPRKSHNLLPDFQKWASFQTQNPLKWNEGWVPRRKGTEGHGVTMFRFCRKGTHKVATYNFPVTVGLVGSQIINGTLAQVLLLIVSRMTRGHFPIPGWIITTGILSSWENLHIDCLVCGVRVVMREKASWNSPIPCQNSKSQLF